MVNVAIADDVALFRKGIKGLLEDSNKLHFCLEAADGNELLEQLEKTLIMPDVLLLDISMPGMEGIQTFELVRAKFPQIKILILSIHYSYNYIITLIEKGANGYLSKNTDPEEVETAIQAVVENDFYFNEETIRVMHKSLSAKQKTVVTGSLLTERETEVLKLICDELTTAEIGKRLFISKRTAEGHRNSLLLKTGCKNTAGLVIYAIRHNLFSLNGI